MKALIFLLFIVGCCNTKQQPALTSGVTCNHITFNNTIYGDTTPFYFTVDSPRLYLGSATHPIGTTPLKFTDGKPPILTKTDTLIMDTTFYIINVKRGLCEN